MISQIDIRWNRADNKSNKRNGEQHRQAKQIINKKQQQFNNKTNIIDTCLKLLKTQHGFKIKITLQNARSTRKLQILKKFPMYTNTKLQKTRTRRARK